MTTKEKILTESLKRFLTLAYDRVSLQGIAEELDITKGGIYHYFKSKDDLFLQTLHFFFDKIMQQSLNFFNIDDPLSIILKKLIDFQNMNMFCLEDLKISDIMLRTNYLFMIWTGIKKFPEIRERMYESNKRSLKFMEKIIIQAQTRDEISKDLDPAILAYQLTSMIKGAIVLGMIDKQLNIENFKQDLLDLLNVELSPERVNYA
ncbi:MAG: TetR/AcrR family transcriptional regulator [bacterium]